jgi:alkanesulfonate monooxygenase SsuD/methylene tetrahydromethanopterin reductase-like flavin-dependent oxidoreductase (luciferase family)
MQLPRIGVWTSYRAIGEDNAAEAAQLAEQLGLAFWLGGSPQLPTLRPLLDATERLIVATGIVNVWQYEPGRLAAEYAELADAFPGRLLVGIGIGHPEATSDYAHPLATMRGFLDGLDAATPPLPVQSPLPGGAGAEDARPVRGAHPRRAHLFRAGRPHPRGPRADRRRRDAGRRAGVRARR